MRMCTQSTEKCFIPNASGWQRRKTYPPGCVSYWKQWRVSVGHAICTRKPVKKNDFSLLEIKILVFAWRKERIWWYILHREHSKSNNYPKPEREQRIPKRTTKSWVLNNVCNLILLKNKPVPLKLYVSGSKPANN